MRTITIAGRRYKVAEVALVFVGGTIWFATLAAMAIAIAVIG